MKDPLMCCNEIMYGVEYGHRNPNQYDGVSEWRCERCGKRIGRWSMKVLKDDEHEPRPGGKK